MQSTNFHYLPPFFGILLLLFGLLIAVLQVGVMGYAYEKMGISRLAAYAILFASLIGASINIPVAEIQGQSVVTVERVDMGWGLSYDQPVIKQWPSTFIALNVGGALIPTLLSIYFIFRHQFYGSALLGIFAVSAVVYRLAEPVPHMGISVPIFIPPIVSAVVAVLLSREHAAPLAYVSGCLGTLIGADLLNLGELGRLGASVASIGGAGTFDGVFLTGLLAVLLAGNYRLPWHPRPQVSPPN
ncbi:MAG: DUF1614 domain-containing protein [Pirellulales bacterium]